MNDDELEARLRATLSAKASMVAPRANAWEDYSDGPPRALRSSTSGSQRMWWVSAAAAAALIVFVVVRVTSSPAVKVTAVAPETTDTGVSAPITPATTVETTTSLAAPTTVPPSVPGPVGGPVPAGFAPSSVTFVSLHTGWVLGAAPCGSTTCTELLRTRDGGQTWVGLPRPPMPADARKVRFGNLNDGWIYGPDFWVTHDGGATWVRPAVDGLADGRVYALETDGTVVHAALSDRIVSSPVDRDDWRSAPVTIPLGAGPIPEPQLVVQGGSGWLIENNRTVVGGARLQQQKWVVWNPPCLDKNGPARFTASTATDVVVVCHEGVWSGDTATENVLVSSDGGTAFSEVSGPFTNDWYVEGVASPASGTIVIAGSTTDGSVVLEATFDGGVSWSAVYRAPTQGGTWSDLGFTGPTQGIGIVSMQDGSSELLMTVDGGHQWDAVGFG